MRFFSTLKKICNKHQDVTGAGVADLSEKNIMTPVL